MNNFFFNKPFTFFVALSTSILILLVLGHNDLMSQIKTLSNTDNSKELIDLSKSAIFQLYVLIIFILIIFMAYLYFFKKRIISLNENIEEKVQQKTKQIKYSLMELEKVNLKLYDLAHTDHLTQIKNRRSFFLHADNLLKSIKKYDKVLSIVMIDIDNFKSINDTYGHEIGDTVLVEFTKAITSLLDENIIFGRLGGEEFGIVLPNMNVNQAKEKAEEIRKSIENLETLTLGSKAKVTASFGVHDSNDCKNVDEIISFADRKLYSAKSSGKNRVRSRIY